DLHARIGVAAEHLLDAPERFAERSRLFDQLDDHDLSWFRLAPHLRRHQDVLIDAPVLRDDEGDAALLVEAPDDFTIDMHEHVDDGALRTPAPVYADGSRRDAVAVQRLAHLRRSQEQIRAAIVQHHEAVAVGMSLHRTG